jgi:hypothetical protein
MIRRILAAFAGPLQASSRRHRLPVELLAACIATESGGDPLAERHEPGSAATRRRRTASPSAACRR